MRIKSLILFIGLTLIVLGVVARPTHAADIRTGERVVVAAVGAAVHLLDHLLVAQRRYVNLRPVPADNGLCLRLSRPPGHVTQHRQYGQPDFGHLPA